MSNSSTRFSYYSVVSLFFLWALAHNLNPILIPHLKKACQLSDMQSALVDSSFYIAYFFMALPAGWFVQKMGYQKAIVSGLTLFACGALLFYPAATLLSYPFFLTALFVLASGLTILETAANPYVAVLGEPETAARRLNFAQSFNGLGASLAALLGGAFILSGTPITSDLKSSMTEVQWNEWLHHEALSVRVPYLVIAAVVGVVVFIFTRLQLPDLRSNSPDSGFSIKRLMRYPSLKKAMLAQFFYVGAQVGTGSFFIRYTMQQTAWNDQAAAMYLSIALFLFMSGRFVGSYLMRYVQAANLLRMYSYINMFLLLFVMMGLGKTSVYALMATEFFMSIMFPTIFSIGLEKTGEDARYASSLIVMTIVGGAFIPLIMGAVSDMSNIRFAYVIPLLCYGIIARFARLSLRTSLQ